MNEKLVPPKPNAMRKFKLPLLAIAAITVVVFACRKEREAMPGSGLNGGNGIMKGVGGDCTHGLTIECGMLSFADQAHFQEVYDCLLLRHEAYMDSYEQEHEAMTEDEYDEWAELTGFVDEQTLVNFENALGFVS